MAVKNVKNDDLALENSGPIVTDSTLSGAKKLFNDGVNKGRENTDKSLGDVGTNRGVRIQPPDTTASSVAGTSSSEYNSFNHLKYLKAACSYSVEYYLTAGFLTHAASVLRKAAFDDISAVVRQLNENKIKVQQEIEKQQNEFVKDTLLNSKGSVSKEAKIIDLPPVPLQYDFLNIPWELRVPKDSAEINKKIGTMSSSSTLDIDTEIASSTKDFVPNSVLFMPSGKDEYACPKSVTHQGFKHIGTLTKPIFLPINPSSSYGGIFGKALAQLNTIKSKYEAINSTGALASNRAVVPNKFSPEEPEGSLPILAPILGEYASISSAPIIYNKNTVKFEEFPEITLDAQWKTIIGAGEFFSTVDKAAYSDSDIKSDEIIKHGTDGILKSELDIPVSFVKEKLNSSYFKRIMKDISSQAKAGEKPTPYKTTEAKDFTTLSKISVRNAIKSVPWKDVVNNRFLQREIPLDNIKAGKGITDISNIAGYQFWVPLISSRAQDTDGSTIYSYLEPNTLNSLKAISIFYTKQPPIAIVETYTTKTPFRSYIRSLDSDQEKKDTPGYFIDWDILKYGIGGFGDTSSSKNSYLLPVSGLSKKIFSSVTPLINSDPEFPVTHRVGNKKISLHSAVFRNLAASLGRYAENGVSLIKDSISLSLLKKKSKFKSNSPEQLQVDLNVLMTVGTSLDTVESDEEVEVFVDEDQKNLLGQDKDKTYNKGKIDKFVKIDTNGIGSVQIHIGKTFNAQGINDNVSLASDSVKNILTDSAITQTFASGVPGIFITDIQPGEVLDLKSTPSTSTEDSKVDQSLPADGIEYSIDQSLSKKILYSEDLVDTSPDKGLDAMDIIASLMGDSYSTGDVNENNSDGKPIKRDLGTLLSTASGAAYDALIGDGNLQELSDFWVPLGDNNDNQSINVSSPYNYTKHGDFTSLTASLITLLKSPEILYLEHFEDVKKDPTCLNSLVFIEQEILNPVSNTSEFDIINETTKIRKYINIEDDFSATAVIHSDIEVPIKRGFINYNPWTGFNAGNSEYSKRTEKFALLNIADNKEFRSRNQLYDSIDVYVKFLISEISKPVKRTQILDIFTDGRSPYSLKSDGSNVVQSFTKLYANVKFENIQQLYSQVDSNLLTTLINSIYSTLIFNIYSSLNRDMIPNAGIGDSDNPVLDKILMLIYDNKAALLSIAPDMDIKIDGIIKALSDLKRPGTLFIPEDDRPEVIQLFIKAVICFYFSRLVNKNGYSYDSQIYKDVDDRLRSIGTIFNSLKDTESKLDTIPRYKVVSGASLGLLINKYLNSSSFEGYGSSFQEAREIFTDWYRRVEDSGFLSTEPLLDYSIPSSRMEIPICFVKEILYNSENYSPNYNVYEFLEQGSLDNIQDFANKLESGDYKLLVKVIKPNTGWLETKLLSSDVKLDKISISVRHAASIVNILDYIGFCLQCICEIDKVKRQLLPDFTSPDPLTGRANNRLIRRKRIELNAEYIDDENDRQILPEGTSVLKGQKKGTRRYLVKLNDFCNLARVRQTSRTTTNNVTKMYPIGLKDINSDNPPKDLSGENITESKVIEIGDFSSGKARYVGMFLRPGYGLPDFVEGIGYRCVISDIASMLYGNFKPKRFAFLSTLKSGKSSLKLSRMLENASGPEFANIVKASNWTADRLAEKETSIKDQISSMTLANKYKSSYDNFKPNGSTGKAVFDIKFGYMSTRPLYMGNLKGKVPFPAISIEFGGKMATTTLRFANSHPVNLLYRMETGLGNVLFQGKGKKERITTKLGNDIKEITMPSLNSGTAVKSLSSLEESSKTIIDAYLQLAIFRVGVKIEEEDKKKLNNNIQLVLNDKTTNYDLLTTNIADLIKADKLRDTGFIDNSHLTFGGRLAESPIIGNSPYPFLYPGAFTEKDIKDGNVSKLLSISDSGLSNESLYDLHPLSFITSPTAMGLSKRRSLLTGINILSFLFKKDVQFFKKPNTTNPYAGIYYILKSNFEMDPDLLLSNKRDFKGKNPDIVSIVVIPDFSSDELSVKDLALKALNNTPGLDSKISDSKLAEYFGTGTLLNGEFDEANAEWTPKRELMGRDSKNQANSNYDENDFNVILKHLKKWFSYAKDKSGSEFYQALNGCFFPVGALNSAQSLSNISILKQDGTLFSVDLNLDPASAEMLSIKSDIETVFSQTYRPVVIEGSTFYISGGGISYISLKDYHEKPSGSIANALLKSPIRNLLNIINMIPDESGDVAVFKKVDLYSILSGGKFKNNYSSKTFGNNLAYTNGIGSEVFISAQAYIGSSEKQTDSGIKTFPVAAIEVPGKGRSIPLLTPTRTFGKDNKIKSLFSDNINYNYIVKKLVTVSGNSDKKNKLDYETVEAVNRDGDKFLFSGGSDAFNILGLSRLWLSYNWISEQYSDPSIEVSGGAVKKISEVTLNDLTYVDIEYFVKKIGKLLLTNKDSNYFDFPLKNLLPYYKDTLVSALDTIQSKPYSEVPRLLPNLIGIAGIVNTEIESNDVSAFNPTLSAKTESKDSKMNVKFMNILWSVLSMKVYVGTTDLGIEKEPPIIADEKNSIADAAINKKPDLGEVLLGKGKVYNDIVNWNKTAQESSKFIRILRFDSINGRWTIVNPTSDPSVINNIVDRTKVQESPKLLANQEGLSIYVF